MTEIGTITLYREKSVVHRVEELNDDEDGKAHGGVRVGEPAG